MNDSSEFDSGACPRDHNLPDIRAKNAILYEELKRSGTEPLLNIDDIQGDSVLGFNKPYSLQVVIDIIDPDTRINLVKEWIKDTLWKHLSSTKDVRNHRDANSMNQFQGCNEVFVNVSFGYSCIKKLVHGTKYDEDMDQFDPSSPFVVGASQRSLLVGDDPDDEMDYGKGHNNDILLSFGADCKEGMLRLCDSLLEDTTDYLMKVNSTMSFRGDYKSPLYSHEHFGFLDGLSQPEVRGTYKKEDGKVDFVVKRRIVATESDDRYKNYSRPGFRLLDTGHFLLGHLVSPDDPASEYGLPDTQDGEMQNPNPPQYRNLEQKYPSWCLNSSYAVYRKIEQNVPGFWSFMLDQAKKLATEQEWEKDVDTLKQLAGIIAAKCIGRFWDGTPLSFGQPMTGIYYPPDDENICKPQTHLREGQINGFQFDSETAPWLVWSKDYSKINKVEPPENMSHKGNYKADYGGKYCPFGGHIRKVNPRDEFTDIGSNIQTNKHRIIRRGNNYGNRVKDVFQPKAEEKEHLRGLALVMYQGDIANQFEFVQRHWANSSTRPRAPGDDFVIGLPPKDPVSKELVIDVSEIKLKGCNFKDSKPRKFVVQGHQNFTHSKGMGYFLLPSLSTIKEVLCSGPLSPDDSCQQREITYHPPAFLDDFRYASSKYVWDWTVESLYWSCIWDGNNYTNKTGQIVMPTYLDMSACGIAYRLPDVKSLAKEYQENELGESYLQFRSTKDFNKIAERNGNNAADAIISWRAFPKRILDLYSNSDVNPYEYVEKLGWPSKDVTYRKYTPSPLARQMDEYCEWFTHRDDQNRITRIDITCEPPEYYIFLFNHEPDTLLSLYRQYVSPLVKMEDLTNPDGSYNMYNEWNTTKGAMHLNCPPNSLFAEVYIAAEASTRWEVVGDSTASGNPVVATTGGDLITSGQYGLPTRASDPTIGANVNSLIRSGNIVTIADPCGLYLENLDTTGWQDNKKRPLSKDKIDKIVTYERFGTVGDLRMNSRIRIEVPQTEEFDFVLGDCFLGGVPIDWAGQIIDASVTVFLRGRGTSGNGFIKSDAATRAVVPPKRDWNGVNIGPKAQYVPLTSAPEPPYDLAPPK